MKNTFGNNIAFTLFGESHSKEIGIVIDGLSAGIALPFELIDSMLLRRRPAGNISTKRQEPDNYSIVSGYFGGFTTGTPLCITIPNVEQHSKDYEDGRFCPRPSHADFTAHMKYEGFEDYRGGGHFSGRLTAPIVIAGAICTSILQKKGILIGTHIKSCAGIIDADFNENCINEQVSALSKTQFPCLDSEKSAQMQDSILMARKNGDSVGGVLESVVIGLKAGVGEPFFGSVESVLSSLLFSIPAVKGVEFGLGFGFSDKLGSSVADEFYYNDGIKTHTNHNGGINGGISNGMPIIARCVIKPTPSILMQQKTVNLQTLSECERTTNGRHDPCILHRAAVVVDSVLSIGLLDLLIDAEKYLFQKGE